MKVGQYYYIHSVTGVEEVSGEDFDAPEEARFTAYQYGHMRDGGPVYIIQCVSVEKG